MIRQSQYDAMKTFKWNAFSFLGVTAGGNYIPISLVCLTCLISSINAVAGIVADSDSDDATAAGPTNNYISLPRVSGFVRAFDSNGLVIESNSVYFPRIAIRDLSESELRQLLEAKAVYAALTAFGNTAKRTSDSVGFEEQMRQIWDSGKSLRDKVTVRLEIIRRLRLYNDLLDNINRANYESEKAGNASMALFEFYFPRLTRSADGLPDAGTSVVNFYRIVESNPTSDIALLEQKSRQAKKVAQEERKKAFNQKLMLSRLGFKILSFTAGLNSGLPTPKIVIDPATGLPIDTSTQDYTSDDDETILFKIPSISMKVEIDAETTSNSDSSNLVTDLNHSTIQTNEVSSLDEKMVKLLIKYADEGNDGPQYQLGVRYLEGRGVSKDKAKGIEYLKKSAAQQNEDAKKTLHGLGIY